MNVPRVFRKQIAVPCPPSRQLEDQKAISEKLQTAALISLMHHRELSDSGFFDYFGLPSDDGITFANIHCSHWKCQYCCFP